tara:strand:+ start:6177 stop:6557 length:381 start_codon:yes stop_codon:yes gene_type:complete
MFKDMKKLYVLLILLSILLITNITLNLISNEKYSDFETKPDFYYKYNNFREYDLYNKLVNYNNFFKRIDEGETGHIKRDLTNKIDYVDVKTGTGDRSINEAILSFQSRKDKLQEWKDCINEGEDCY